MITVLSGLPGYHQAHAPAPGKARQAMIVKTFFNR
jgi:hypothetical protein